MFLAIHKETGEKVSAWKFLKNPFWIGKEKEEFIAPSWEIANYDELNHDVRVCFVRKSVDGKRAHFRILDDDAISVSSGESPLHREIKEKLYEMISNDEISFIFLKNKLKASELNIRDIFVEGRTSTYGGKIADILLIFDSTNTVLGNGIAVEVQLSPQNTYKTEERSQQRALDGFSCAWIFKEDIEGVFTKKEIVVQTLSSCLNDFVERKQDEFLDRIRDYWLEFEGVMNNLNKHQESIQIQIRKQEEHLEEVDKKIGDERVTLFKSIMEQLEKNVLKDINLSKNFISEQILETYKNRLIEGIEDVWNKGEVNKRVSESVAEQVREVINLRKDEFYQIASDKIESLLKEVDWFKEVGEMRKGLLNNWLESRNELMNKKREIEEYLGEDLGMAKEFHERVRKKMEEQKKKDGEQRNLK